MFLLLFFVVFLALLACLVGRVSAASTQPNIIFVMADDMGWGQP